MSNVTHLSGHNLNFVFREMNGKTMVQNMSFNNYGLVINGKILGTEVTLREVFKRVTPQISGYYIYESEVRGSIKKDPVPST